MTLASVATNIVEFALGNVAIALPLGLVAWWLQRRGTQPYLAHLLWLVVLIKLVTPPLYSLSIANAVAPAPEVGVFDFGFGPGADASGSVTEAADPGWLAAVDWRAAFDWLTALDWQVAVVALWLAGSLLVLVRASTRAWQFNRLLRLASEPAAPNFRLAAARLGAALGLKRTPAVMVTSASISPMVWWIGGPVRIYLPRTMVLAMCEAELCDILAHELGHVRRGDHYVRWLECLVGIALWWNPLAWWARRNLRVCEEICCDAFVLARTRGSRDDYAGALVSAMELLATPTLRPKALASHVNGGFIERRITMILSGKTITEAPRWLRGLVIASAALVVPLGFTLAQDGGDDLEKVRQWLESGVNSAFLTQEQADIMLGALKLAETHMIRLLDSDGNIVVNRVPAEVVRPEGNVQRVLQREELEIALDFANKFFRERAELGLVSIQEAEAIIEDIKEAIETGLAHGTAYYDRQFELGLISRDTAERRMRLIQEMEQAFNQTPQGAARQFTQAGGFVVQAVPTEVQQIGGAPVRVLREGQSAAIEVVREKPIE